ncbi:MAG: LutB/LldF family L-lactate oxidation iron-sulfur protein [Actinomycetota bacterium]|nr:LutB/LldF family L-lactate oxidation iron-sulfur protein [Actinomycetota bacterium]
MSTDSGRPEGPNEGIPRANTWLLRTEHRDQQRSPVSFKSRSTREIRNLQMRKNISHATSTIREKRKKVVSEVENWEELRTRAAQIKQHTLSNLDFYLEEYERNVTEAGGQVHWARDATEARQIALELVRESGAQSVIKVKSMVTEEIGLNDFLVENGIEPTETDLAELICQLAGDESSHILVPAIHRNRVEIRDIFEATFAKKGTLEAEPSKIAEAARQHLREKFLESKVAITGGNFLVAETGSVAIVESEGNGRMCLTLPNNVISIVGIEKLIPTMEDLEVFLTLLPRSSTGERMNPYTTIWTGRPPAQLELGKETPFNEKSYHIILLDNGRTRVLSDEIGKQALSCIRCSACLNVCPVYERVGGHSYESVYPGPIGAILTPQLVGDPLAGELAFASTLCGACYEVCPVKINIPEILIHLRSIHSDHKRDTVLGNIERGSFGVVGIVMGNTNLFNIATASVSRILKYGGPVLNRVGKYLPPINGWIESRTLPDAPKETLRDAYRKGTLDALLKK